MNAIQLVIDNQETDNQTYRYLKLGRKYAPELPRKSVKRRVYLEAESKGHIDKWKLMAELVTIKEEPHLMNRFWLHMGKYLATMEM